MTACKASEEVLEGQNGSPLADVAAALTRSFDIANGTVELGDLPVATAPEAELAALELSDESLEPGGTVLLGFDVDDPDGRVPEATLIQFAGSDDHIEAPVMASGANNSVEIEVSIADAVCDGLCDVEHTIELTVAVVLDDGGVSSHHRLEITLDCRNDGSADDCVRIDEHGEPVSSSKPPRETPGTTGRAGSSAPMPTMPSDVDTFTACSNVLMHCPAALEPTKPPEEVSGPASVDECTTGFTCLFENADDDACTDLLIQIGRCLQEMGESCMACSDMVLQLDETGVCVGAEGACFMDMGSGGGTGGGGAGSGGSGVAGGGGSIGVAGSGSGASACSDALLDKPVAQFTEAEARESCLCGYEDMPGVDPAMNECFGRAIWAAASPAECDSMVQACLADPVICDGAEQLGFLTPCMGTLRDLQGCFVEATVWQASLTCAAAGPDNEAARIRGMPQCLMDLCMAGSGSADAMPMQ